MDGVSGSAETRPAQGRRRRSDDTRQRRLTYTGQVMSQDDLMNIWERKREKGDHNPPTISWDGTTKMSPTITTRLDTTEIYRVQFHEVALHRLLEALWLQCCMAYGVSRAYLELYIYNTGFTAGDCARSDQTRQDQV